MKKITLKTNGTFEHQWIEGLHSIPENAINVTNAVFMQLSQNPQSKKYDPTAKIVIDYMPLFILSDAQQQKSTEIEGARNNAMFQHVLSNALGEDHTYSVTERNNNFLNNLITLGNGSKFTCVDENGLKKRVFHSNAQLIVLANDIEAHIAAQFDHYELKLAELELTNSQTEIDAVVW